MIYLNKVLYCLSFIGLVTVCLGNTSSEHLIKGRQYADRPLAVTKQQGRMTNDKYKTKTSKTKTKETTIV